MLIHIEDRAAHLQTHSLLFHLKFAVMVWRFENNLARRTWITKPRKPHMYDGLGPWESYLKWYADHPAYVVGLALWCILVSDLILGR